MASSFTVIIADGAEGNSSMTQISPSVERALEIRGISTETALRFGIYTADEHGAPSGVGNVIVFPFWEHGVSVNEKFRAPGKKFWQRSGGRRTFWNSDVLDDPALHSGHMPLVITEGEIDALTAIECGFPLTVSVPDGAPPEKRADKNEDAANDDDQHGKYEFLWNNRDRLKRIKRFIIAVDGDAPGQRLASELVRRLSAARCSFVSYPGGCKDISDVQQRFGSDAVVSLLNRAKPYPVRGLYRISDYPNAGPLPVYSSGWWTLDEHAKFFLGAFVVISGIPSHGKSTFVSNLLVNFAEQHGWTSAIYTPEMPIVPQMRDKLRRIKGRSGLLSLSPDDLIRIDRWLDRAFVFIDADPNSDDDEEFNLIWVLDKATDAVLRDGIKVLVIDPWNELEHARAGNESMSDYIGRSIRSIKRWAKTYQVIVIVVAHPTKDVGKDGAVRRPGLYDIEGSSHWANKADIGIIIDWPDHAIPHTVVDVKKIRFEECGGKGSVKLKFDRYSARYSTLDEEETHGSGR